MRTCWLRGFGIISWFEVAFVTLPLLLSNLTACRSSSGSGAPPYILKILIPQGQQGTVTSADGKISCGSDCEERYPARTQVSLTAQPDPGWIFRGWTGDCSGNTPEIEITMDANKTCTATFAQEITQENTILVRPEEDTVSLYANPGMGWQTFHRPACAVGPFSPDENVRDHGIPSSTLYRRFDWDELEPEEGNFAFSWIEQLWLEWAKACGQRLSLRVQLAADAWQAAPLWLQDISGVAGWEYFRDGNDNGVQDYPTELTLWTPDLTNPTVLSYHNRLVQKLGEKYNGHPFIDLLDIGSVGLWGEWHFSSTKIIRCTPNRPDCPIGQEIPLPPEEVRRSIIAAWAAAFPQTPLAMNIYDDRYYDNENDPNLGKELAYAIDQHRTGWRGDCWGHWFPQQIFYPAILKAADNKINGGASQAWRDGAVALEPCGDMKDWWEHPRNYWYRGDQQVETIDTVLQWAIDHHATYIQSKQGRIPDDWVSKVKDVLRKLGYRLVLRELRHPRAATLGSAFPISMTWENVGVAPPYWDYFLQVRLKQGNIEWVSPPLLSIKGWQPGTRVVRVEVTLPANLPAGEYELSLGIFSPHPEHNTYPNLKFVKLAIQTLHDGNGWYTLSRLRLQ